MKNKPVIGVVGLGYVGLPLALAFARVFEGVRGFDISERKVNKLLRGIDPTGEGSEKELRETSLKITSSIEDLKDCNFYVVTVPTPVDKNNRPDLGYLRDASRMVGSVIEPRDIVVYESTVYPGVTEDVCGPEIAIASGLEQGRDFFLGYSPERINPGDQEHGLANVVKIVSGETPEVLDVVADVYSAIVKAGVHKASSIKVAEAAKVVENTQRDLNIALMNELAIIFDRMGVKTTEVVRAAATKWNFNHYTPGLVGGHCIGVDPYYLTSKAEQLGYLPEVILAGRRVNDRMGTFIAQKLIKLFTSSGINPVKAKVGILGITFKENVSDLRNSRVPSIVSELEQYGIEAIVCDPVANDEEALDEYGIKLSSLSDMVGLDALILAVAHREFLEPELASMLAMCKSEGAVFVDVKSKFGSQNFPSSVTYWSL